MEREELKTSGASEEGKRGLPVIAWIGIGCGALVVIVGIVLLALALFAAHKIKQGVEALEENPALASARAIVRMNPELEEVSYDESSGTMTIRNERTGEEITLDLDDIQDGRFSISSGEKRLEIDTSSQEGGEGEGSLRVSASDGESTTVLSAGAKGEVPEWVPVYADVEKVGWYSLQADQRHQGGFQIVVDAQIDEVVKHYKEQLESEGFTVTTSIMRSSEGSGGTLEAIAKDSSREVNLMIGEADGQISITTVYSEPL